VRIRLDPMASGEKIAKSGESSLMFVCGLGGDGKGGGGGGGWEGWLGWNAMGMR